MGMRQESRNRGEKEGDIKGDQRWETSTQMAGVWRENE